MHDNQCPPCIIRTSPDTASMPVDIRYLTVTETENLLDAQEELISTPMKVKFHSTVEVPLVSLKHRSFEYSSFLDK